MKRETELGRLRAGEKLTLSQQLRMIITLSVPAIFSQISSIIMQYIDASMVGRLGADASASIGLVSSSTWLVNGVCSAVAVGFTVQIAHRIGAGKDREARAIVRQGLLSVFCFALAMSLAASAASGHLPVWLGQGKTCAGMPALTFLYLPCFFPCSR